MKIIAHRGDSANHPENTSAGWDAAYAAGAYAIEVDIRFSSDGVGVCAHDAGLARLFGRAEQVSDLTIQQLSALTNENGAYIALFADALSHVVQDRPVLLDLKDETPDGLEHLWREIQANVPPQNRHLITAGCHTLEAVRFIADRGEIDILGFIQDRDAGPAFVAAGAKFIRLWEGDVTPDRMKQLRDLGVEIWVTAGEGATKRLVGDTSAESLKLLAEAGVTAVLVNDVAFAIAAVEALR